MDSKSTILVVLVVAVIAVAAGCLIGMNINNNNNGPTSEPDLTGYWCHVSYESCNGENFYATDDGDTVAYKTEYGLNISEYDDGVFCGTYCNIPVTGSYIDGVINFHGTGDGAPYVLGTMIGDEIYLSSVQKNKGVYETYCAVFSKNIDSAAHRDCNIDINGEWKVFTAKMLNVDGKDYDLGGDDLTVKQKGHVFSAKMEQVIDGSEVFIDIVGVLTEVSSQGKTIGLAIGGGERLFVYTDGNMLQFLSTDKDDTGYDTANTSFNRVYSRDGNKVEYAIEDLKDKTFTGYTGMSAWREIDGYSISGICPMYNQYTLTITEQIGSIFIGVSNYLGEDLKIAGSIFGSHLEIATFFQGELVWEFATLTESGMDLTECYEDPYFGSVTNLTNFVENVPSLTDPTGLWYCCSANVVNKNGDVTYTTNSDYESASVLTPLVILEVKDGLFTGIYEDMYVAGTFSFGSIKFNSQRTVDGVTTDIQFYGTAVNDYVFTAREIWNISDGTQMVIHTVYTTTDELWANMLFADDPVGGEWTMSVITDYSTDLSDIPETITGAVTRDVGGGLVYGEIISSTTDPVSFIGAKAVADKSIYLLGIDKDGNTFYATITGDTLCIEKLYVEGKAHAQQMLFVRNGSEVIIPAYADLKDTAWKSDSCMSVDSSSNEFVKTSFEMIVTASTGQYFAGTLTDNGVESSFVGETVIPYGPYSLRAITDSGQVYIMFYSDGADEISVYKLGAKSGTSYAMTATLTK